MKWSRSFFYRPGVRWSTLRSATRLLGVISSPCLLIADFLAEDSCIICGSNRPASAAAVEGAQADRERECADLVRALTFPVAAPFLFGTLHNRPVCPSCARTFEPARSAGCLGYAEPGRRIVTAGSAIFECVRDGSQLAEFPDPGACYPIRILAPWMTNDAVLHIVHIFKYRSCTSLVQVIARSMAVCVERFRHTVPPDALLIPVPRFDRNGNRPDHAALIAGALAAELRMPWDPEKLRKIRSTASQSKTAGHLRALNVRGAFEARGVRNRDVILVDDLVTTGSTAGSCAAALASAGARPIALYCFGRAL